MTGNPTEETARRVPRPGPPPDADRAPGSTATAPLPGAHHRPARRGLPEAHPVLDRIIRRDQVFAAVPRVRRVEGDPAVHTHTCLPGPAVAALGRFGRYTRCGGAGFRPADSWIAAAAEGLERYRAITFSTRAPYWSGSWSQLPGEGVDPRAWNAFSAEQYATPGFTFRPLTEHTRVKWLLGEELGSGRPVWLPGPAVSFPYLRSAGEERVLPAVTTGLAFGFAPRDAARSALWEVIERDALVLAWHWQLPVRRITADQGVCRDIARAAELDDRYRVDAFDITSDIGVPVCLVILRVRDAAGTILAAGSACRGSRAAALRKAFLEALQGVPYVRHLRTSLGDWRFGGDFAEVRSFEHSAAFYSLFPDQLRACLAAHPEFLNVRGTPVTVHDGDEGTGEQAGDEADGTGASGLDGTLAALRARGHRAYVLDMSGEAMRADGCTVVRVVVPGLYSLEGAHRFRGGNTARARAAGRHGGAVPVPNPFPHPLP